jgi:acyl-CoA thioester hydrolase
MHKQAPHNHIIRVYVEDTDMGGVVYYANYLCFLERARSEFCRNLGINQSEMIKNYGLYYVVRHCAIDYIKPAMLDDVLTVHTKISEIKNASLIFEQVILRDGVVLTEAKTLLVCITKEGKLSRIPAAIRSKITQ